LCLIQSNVDERRPALEEIGGVAAAAFVIARVISG